MDNSVSDLTRNFSSPYIDAAIVLFSASAASQHRSTVVISESPRLVRH